MVATRYILSSLSVPSAKQNGVLFRVLFGQRVLFTFQQLSDAQCLRSFCATALI